MHLRQPFGRISLIVAWIAVVGQLVTAGAFLFVHEAIRDLFPEPVTEEALRDANAGEVEAASKRSKIKSTPSSAGWRSTESASWTGAWHALTSAGKTPRGTSAVTT